MSNIASNIQQVRQRMADAARVRGLAPEGITLVAVSKGHPVSAIQAAVAVGITDIGENRVQEALPKWAALEPGPRWHLVGTLQSNKAGKAMEFADLIQSIDRLSLARELSRLAQLRGRPVHGLLQVNTSAETSKHGVAPATALDLLRAVSGLPGLYIDGLMTIGPLAPDPEQARPAFRQLRTLFTAAARLRLPHVEMCWLSMGMSSDYSVAIEEGANLVRIGSAIFGPRA